MTPAAQLLEFGVFRVDVPNRVFTRENVEVALTPKVFDLLAELVRSDGQLLERESLLRRIWPDTFSPKVFTCCVSVLARTPTAMSTSRR
jgi:DNA-binding response OmpR family regulator